MKLKTLLLVGVLMFTIPCGVALAEEVSAPDPPVIGQPAEPVAPEPKPINEPETIPPHPAIINDARENEEPVPDGSLKPEANTNIEPTTALVEPIEQRIVLESVSGIPETLRVYLTIRGNVVAEVKGSQILNTTYFDSVDKAEIKIRLKGEGRLHGARFIFAPVRVPELPPMPILPEEEELLNEEEFLEEELVEEPTDEELVEEPTDEELVEEPTDESTNEELVEDPVDDPADNPIDNPIGDDESGDVADPELGETSETSDPDYSNEADSGESVEGATEGPGDPGDAGGDSGESTSGDSGSESGDSGSNE